MPLLSLSVSQLLLAFVSASILHKLTFNRFFLKWLASHKFVCFLVPSNNELRRIKEKTKDRGAIEKKGHPRQKNRNKTKADSGDSKEEIFKIPTANLDSLRLDKTVIGVQDLELICYSVDLEWIVDLALMSIFSFTITEAQFYLLPQSNQCNFSLLWALLVVLYCIKTLWNLNAIYFKNEKSIGERSICIISGCIFLLLSMVILIANENYLEFGLEGAYRSFNESATAMVRNHTFHLSQDAPKPPIKPVSLILVKFTIAILCSLTGVVFTFPGLRFGQLHKGLLDKAETTSPMQIMYNLNYLAPLIVVCLWIKPISRKPLTDQDLLPIGDETFDTIRIYCIIILNLLRFYQLPKYVATFLLSVGNRITRIKYRGGTTTNLEIQTIVSSIYNYFNVVTIQYILPILMCLFTSIMFATMGEQNWIPLSLSKWLSGMNEYTRTANMTSLVSQVKNDSFTPEPLNITETVAQNDLWHPKGVMSIASIVNMAEIKQIFSPDVFRGIFGFATWWLHFSWFCTSTTGVIYHTYFTH